MVVLTLAAGTREHVADAGLPPESACLLSAPWHSLSTKPLMDRTVGTKSSAVQPMVMLVVHLPATEDAIGELTMAAISGVRVKHLQ
jgi:hypothetical protein